MEVKKSKVKVTPWFKYVVARDVNSREMLFPSHDRTIPGLD